MKFGENLTLTEEVRKVYKGQKIPVWLSAPIHLSFFLSHELCQHMGQRNELTEVKNLQVLIDLVY